MILFVAPITNPNSGGQRARRIIVLAVWCKNTANSQGSKEGIDGCQASSGHEESQWLSQCTLCQRGSDCLNKMFRCFLSGLVSVFACLVFPLVLAWVGAHRKLTSPGVAPSVLLVPWFRFSPVGWCPSPAAHLTWCPTLCIACFSNGFAFAQ